MVWHIMYLCECVSGWGMKYERCRKVVANEKEHTKKLEKSSKKSEHTSCSISHHQFDTDGKSLAFVFKQSKMPRYAFQYRWFVEMPLIFAILPCIRDSLKLMVFFFLEQSMCHYCCYCWMAAASAIIF